MFFINLMYFVFSYILCHFFIIQVDNMDEKRLRYLSYTCRGCFAPLCAFLGGVIAQEALKALTGKFTPLNQWVSY